MLRTLVTAIVAAGTFFFTFIIGGAWLDTDGEDWMLWVLSVSMTLGAAAIVWKQSSARAGFISTVFTGAVVTGSIAFCAGFFGPMLLAPQSNQGPLLGIFITGPAGFVVGGVGGAIHWTIRRFRLPNRT